MFLGFTLIPVLEIYFLIKVGSFFGPFLTILIVIGTGVLGAYLARQQGLRTMMKVRESLGQGTMPAEELIDALLIVVAGVVLLTPGFMTDTIGFLLLVPGTRTVFKRWLKNQFQHSVTQDGPTPTHIKNIN